MNNTRFNQNSRVPALVIAVMFITGAMIIGCTEQPNVDQSAFEGGIAITDTSGVSKNVYSVSSVVSLNEDSVKKELSYMAALDMEERPPLSVGDIAPEFEAKQLDSSTFRLADYREKKAILIDFWATWCGPCIDEIPKIKRIAETYRDQGLEVVGVSLDRDEQALRDFVKQENLSYVQVYEKEKMQTISKSYGVWGIPSVFLVDKNGVINAMKLRGERTEAAVKKLLDTN